MHMPYLKAHQEEGITHHTVHTHHSHILAFLLLPYNYKLCMLYRWGMGKGINRCKA